MKCVIVFAVISNLGERVRMANKDLKVGDRVMLSGYTEDPDDDNNPQGVVGTIIDIEGTYYLEVRWDNGKTNFYNYKKHNLVLQSNEDINITVSDESAEAIKQSILKMWNPCRIY